MSYHPHDEPLLLTSINSSRGHYVILDPSLPSSSLLYWTPADRWLAPAYSQLASRKATPATLFINAAGSWNAKSKTLAFPSTFACPRRKETEANCWYPLTTLWGVQLFWGENAYFCRKDKIANFPSVQVSGPPSASKRAVRDGKSHRLIGNDEQRCVSHATPLGQRSLSFIIMRLLSFGTWTCRRKAYLLKKIPVEQDACASIAFFYFARSQAMTSFEPDVRIRRSVYIRNSTPYQSIFSCWSRPTVGCMCLNLSCDYSIVSIFMTIYSPSLCLL